jgi:hypothetical protein
LKVLRPSAIAAAAVAAGVLVGGVHAAAREGGWSIETAPDVVLGEVEYGAPENGARFWRIPLLRRDSLVLDVSNEGLSSRDGPIRYCLLAPKVNDDTLVRSACAWQRTLARGERYRLRFSADSTGSWTLGAVAGSCPTFQRCVTAVGRQPFVYEFTASVRHFTRTTLVGPRVVRPRARLRLTGAVTGANGGEVQIQSALAGGSWRSAAVVALGRSGKFTWSTRASSEPGAARVRAVYRGDGSHLPSSATHSYRIAGAR